MEQQLFGSPRWSKRLRRISLILTIGILLIALSALAGWAFDIPRLTSPFLADLPINPLSAVHFLLVAMVLIFLHLHVPGTTRIAKIVSVYISFSSIYILLEKLFSFSFRIDVLLFREQMERYQAPSAVVGGMSVATAISFLINGIVLWQFTRVPKNRSYQQLLSLVTLFISIIPLVLYLFKVPEVNRYFMMAPLTAACFVVLAISTLMLNPQEGFIREVVSNHVGGFAARYLVPLAVLVPIFIGYLRLVGQWNGFISTELGVSILTLTFSFVFGSATWLLARALNRRSELWLRTERLDEELSTANKKLQETLDEVQATNEELASSNEELSTLLEQLSAANEIIAQQKDEQLNRVLDASKDVIWSFDLTGNGEHYLSRSAERIYQRPYYELIRRPYFWLDNLHPEDIEKTKGAKQLLDTKGLAECTYRVILNGDIHWFHDECRLVKDERGTPLRLEGVASDVTDQKEQQEELENTRLQLTSIFANSSDNFVLLDQQGQIIFFNKGYRQFVEQFAGKEVALGMSLFDTVPEDRVEANRSAFTRALGGETINVIGETERFGEPHYFNIRYGPVTQNGHVTHVTLSAFEITHQKKQEKILEQYKQNLEIIFNRTRDVFILVDTNLKTLQFNKAAYDMSAEISGVPLAVGGNYIDSAPAHRKENLELVLKQVLNGESVTLTTDFIGLNGKTIQYKVAYEPVFSDGKITHITIGGTDISKIKSQEKLLTEYRENLELIFQNSTDFFLLISPEAKVILFNRPFEKFALQYPKVKIKPGTNFYDLVSRNRVDAAKALIARVLKGESVRTIAESVFETETKYYDVMYTPIIKDGVVTHITVSSTDITEEKIKEKEIEKYRANLDIIFKSSKDTFLLLDADGKVVLFNNSFERMVKVMGDITPKVGMDFMEVVMPYRRKEAEQLLKKARGAQSISAEAEFTSRSGEKIYHLVRYEPVFTKDIITHICITGVDVTDYRKIENELKQDKFFLEKASEAATLGYWTSEPGATDGKLTWSKEIFDIFGITPAEFDGTNSSFFSRIFPEDQKHVLEESTAALTQKKPYDVDHRIVRPDGSIRWVNERAQVLFDQHDQPTLMVGIVQDITERKNTELKLIEGQYFLRKAAESAKIGYWTSYNPLSETGKLVWSREIFETFGLNPDNFSGTNKAFFELTHPEDLDRVVMAARLCITQDIPFAIDHRIILPDGRVRWISQHGQMLPTAEGEVPVMVGTSQDINDRKMIEEVLREYNDRFEILSKATNDAIWDWDITNDHLHWNYGITSIFGYKKNEVDVVTMWENKIHPADHDRIDRELKHVFKNKLTNWSSEYQFLCRDGSYKYVLDRAYVIYKDEKPVRMIGAMQDVSEIMDYRLNLENIIEDRTQKLNQALLKEKELVDLKSKFISIASHEFRTPLTTISLSANFLRRYKDKLNQELLVEKVGTIEKQVHHMTSLLEDVLFVGKAEDGKVAVHLKPYEPAILKALALEAMHSRIDHGQFLDFKLSGHPVKFMSDEKLLRNIIFNLITNAVKFSPDARKVFVTVQFKKDTLQLAVRDEGIGIPKEELKNLFNSFTRATNAATIEGTGLGLLIVKKATELLNGTVTVASEVGKGTEFTITLPLVHQ